MSVGVGVICWRVRTSGRHPRCPGIRCEITTTTAGGGESAKNNNLLESVPVGSFSGHARDGEDSEREGVLQKDKYERDEGDDEAAD